MARHYSTKDFFRQMPNVLLARYFHEQNLFQDLDFTAMKEGNPAALFEVWLVLPDNQRNAMDTEFLEIFEMSCEKGSTAIIDEAGFQFNDNDFSVFVEKLSALPNHYQRAMITFLDHNTCWKGFRIHLGIISDPFYTYRKSAGWEPRFKIYDNRGAADERARREAERRTTSYEQLLESGEKIGSSSQSHHSFDSENDDADDWLKNNDPDVPA